MGFNSFYAIIIFLSPWGLQPSFAFLKSFFLIFFFFLFTESKRSLPISYANRISFSSLALERLPWHGPSPLGKEPVARPSIWDSKGKLSRISNRRALTNPTPLFSLCFHPAWITSAKLLEEASLEENAQNMNSSLEFHKFNQWWHVSVFVVVLINDFSCWQEISYAWGVGDFIS